VNTEEIGVLLFGYNRPQLLKRRIKELERMKIKNLFISIDGGSKSHTKEMDVVKKMAKSHLGNVRNLRIMHYKENLGMVNHFNIAMNKVFKEHKYVVFIEDDIILSENFMSNMTQGFSEQSKLKKIGFVSSFSPFFSNSLPNRWRNSFYPFVWGIGFSRDIWNLYDKDFGKIHIEDSLAKSLNWNQLSNFQKKYWLQKFKKIKNDPKYTYDYQLVYLALRYNVKNISPVFTMVGNEGFHDPNASHTTGKKPRFVTTKYLNNRLIRKKTSFTRAFKFLDSAIVMGDSISFYLYSEFQGNKRRVLIKLLHSFEKMILRSNTKSKES
jgi:GR25 family glycosyltransferase involved in LPS biosynthesis